MMSRTYPNPTDEHGKRELDDIMRAVRNNFPGLLDELKPTTEHAQAFLRRFGINKPIEPKGLHVIFTGGPLLSHCIEVFAKKLSCALHYKHTGRILTPAGGIMFRWHTNYSVLTEDISKDARSITWEAARVEASSNLSR